MILAVLLSCGVSASLREGKSALEAGDLVSAEAAWRAALQADPENAEALAGLGWTYHLAGQEDTARSSFQQCVNLHPDAAPCYRGLGSVALAEGNIAQARKHLNLAMQRAPDDPATRHSLGLLELAAGNPDQALTIFQQLLAGEPDRSEYQEAAAECLLALQRAEEASEVAGKAVDNARVPRQKVVALMTRAKALVALTASRVDPSRCAQTAPPIYGVLEEANRNLDLATTLGVPVPGLNEVRRMIQRRKAAVEDQCPGSSGMPHG